MADKHPVTVDEVHAEVDDRERSGPHLKPNSLGVAALLFIVLSAQAPLTGVAGAAPIAIATGNGTGAPGTYVIAGVVIALFAVGYIAMSRHVVSAGGFYAYIGQGLGRPIGSGGAMVAVLGYASVQAAMYGLLGVILTGLFTQVGLTLPWWVWALVAMGVVQLFGVLDIDVGGKVLAVLVLAETSILVAFDVAVLFTGGGPEGLAAAASFSPGQVLSGAPGIALMFAIASMFGFESTAIYAEEAKNPERTVPRATYLSVATITGFYALTTWMFVAFYGPGNAVGAAGRALESGDATVFIFDAVAAKLGAWTLVALPILLSSSLLAGVLAFHNGINRYLFSLSRDGLLPGAADRINRHGAPWVASVVQTVSAIVLTIPFALAGADPVLTLFSWLSGSAVLCVMVLYVLTSLSVVVYFRRTRSDTRLWQTLVAPALATIAILGLVWLILANFTTLVGGSETAAVVLALAVPVVFAAGVVLAVARGAASRKEPTP